jgi:hypothetical protein
LNPNGHSQAPLGKHFPLFKQESDSPALQPISKKENQLKIIYICKEKLILHVRHVDPSNPILQMHFPFELHVPSLRQAHRPPY